MNRADRRAANKILKLDAGKETFGEDACVMCAFVNVQVVGGRQSLYKDKQGRQIELSVSSRLEPPYGLRWPYDLDSRPPCRYCKGGTRESTTVVNGQIVRSRNMCTSCYGLGRELRGDEFAQLCESCAKFVAAWLEARTRAHFEKHMTAGGRLITATPGPCWQARPCSGSRAWAGSDYLGFSDDLYLRVDPHLRPMSPRARDSDPALGRIHARGHASGS